MIPSSSFFRATFRLILSFLAVLQCCFGSTFKTARLVPTAGVGPNTVAVGDFNHDGKLDMVVTDHTSSSVSVLLGNGNGTFKTATQIALDGPPVAVVVGDFNGDGDLNVVALTTDVFVLLGNGDGTFRVGKMFSVGSQPTSMVAADFNHDGKLDLAVSEVSGVDILAENGEGGFSP